ncbi:protein GLUTAMINE DUMPER 2-like [Silene latifolia]|uniref:protein GLUTAMINE DUMPER 2-like n=1 Tax=Silene latifolia TaxID=37657 RepID=UPI003D777F6B
MRRGNTFELVHIVKKPGSYGAESLPPHQHRQVVGPATGWKSPVPYLFGGLAAMLGLIAFALLILACSYWKLSGHMDGGDDGGDGDDEKVKTAETVKAVYENSIFVIMAGEEKPTFLATPATSRTTSFGVSDGKPSCSCSCSSSSSDEGGDVEERKDVQLTTIITTRRNQDM